MMDYPATTTQAKETAIDIYGDSIDQNSSLFNVNEETIAANPNQHYV